MFKSRYTSRYQANIEIIIWTQCDNENLPPFVPVGYFEWMLHKLWGYMDNEIFRINITIIFFLLLSLLFWNKKFEIREETKLNKRKTSCRALCSICTLEGNIFVNILHRSYFYFCCCSCVSLLFNCFSSYNDVFS